MTIAAQYGELSRRLNAARAKSPLAAPQTALMGASKGQPAERIEEAMAAGVCCFGENRVQEAEAKWPALKARHPGVRLHLIGPLQTNKVKEALALFDVIETLDREKLALALARAMESWSDGVMEKKKNAPSPHHPTTPPLLYVQINTGEEPQKSGIAPKEADAFIRYCRDELKLPVTGLMCVPPADQPPAPHFALLRDIAQRHGLHELSMGMSNDFEIAARMGSTCVRIGTALFGERA